jgi:hypothetical protein
MKKRGRPKLPKGTTKQDWLEMRLHPAEKQSFRDAAELSGMALSVWVRERLRKVARKELEEANKPVAFLERASA